jgi:hypothetical protein
MPSARDASQGFGYFPTRRFPGELIGERALLVILGDDGLDIAALHREAPASVERLAKLLDVSPTT